MYETISVINNVGLKFRIQESRNKFLINELNGSLGWITKTRIIKSVLRKFISYTISLFSDFMRLFICGMVLVISEKLNPKISETQSNRNWLSDEEAAKSIVHLVAETDDNTVLETDDVIATDYKRTKLNSSTGSTL